MYFKYLSSTRSSLLTVQSRSFHGFLARPGRWVGLFLGSFKSLGTNLCTFARVGIWWCVSRTGVVALFLKGIVTAASLLTVKARDLVNRTDKWRAHGPIDRVDLFAPITRAVRPWTWESVDPTIELRMWPGSPGTWLLSRRLLSESLQLSNLEF